jgi:hypothetical protein
MGSAAMGRAAEGAQGKEVMEGGETNRARWRVAAAATSLEDGEGVGVAGWAIGAQGRTADGAQGKEAVEEGVMDWVTGRVMAAATAQEEGEDMEAAGWAMEA